MADREEVEASEAYAVMADSGKQVLKVIEAEVRRGAVAISLGQFMARGMCRAAAQNGIKQVELLGFVAISMGLPQSSA